jgi:hypothetical protein
VARLVVCTYTQKKALVLGKINCMKFISYIMNIILGILWGRRSQWQRGLRCRSAVARLLRSWVRIPPAAWMFVCCEYCVLSEFSATGRSPVQRSATECGVSVCDRESSRMRRPWPTLGCNTIEKKLAQKGSTNHEHISQPNKSEVHTSII